MSLDKYRLSSLADKHREQEIKTVKEEKKVEKEEKISVKAKGRRLNK